LRRGSNLFLKSYTFHLILLAGAGLAIAAIMMIPYGPGISTDAVNYLATSENLALGRGFLSYDGELYLLWPPLHPLLLAIPRALFNIDPKASAWAISLFSFPVIIFLTGVILHKALPDRKIWGYLGAVTVLFSTTMLSLAINLGTDLPFVILTLSFFIAFQWFSERRDALSLAAMIVLALLASIERYLGATLVAAGFFGILVLYRRNLKAGLPLAFLFAGISLLPLLLWIGRNYALTGTLFGVRNPGAWKLFLNISDAASKISHWFLPYVVTTNPLFLLLSGLGLGILIGRKSGIGLKWAAGQAQKPIVLIVILYTGIYLFISMFLVETKDHVQIYDDRYYAPIFVPLFLLLFLILDGLIGPQTDKRSWIKANLLLVGLFALWLVFPIYSNYKLWRKMRLEQAVTVYNVYNFPWFNNSLVNQKLLTLTLPEYEKIYSNYAAEVFLFTRTISEGPPSRTDFFGKPVALEDYAGGWPESHPALLVWYASGEKEHLFTPAELDSLVDLEVIYESEDGGIYLLNEESSP
jgi:hypothetical protein